MTRVMILGDSHANRGFVRGALKWASTWGMDFVVQVGDFGYWPVQADGQRFLKAVRLAAEEVDIPVLFIDGNHEDHDKLDLLVAESTKQFVPVGRGGFLYYLPRGTRWEWDGVTFGAFGGAYSIDRARRTKYVSWFPQEMPDESKIESLGKVDVLFAHDAPVVPEPFYATGRFVADDNSIASQKAVERAMRASQPDWLIHGHWHIWHRNRISGTNIVGLDCDQSSLYDSAAVFCTKDRTLYSIAQWEYAQ